MVGGADPQPWSDAAPRPEHLEPVHHPPLVGTHVAPRDGVPEQPLARGLRCEFDPERDRVRAGDGEDLTTGRASDLYLMERHLLMGRCHHRVKCGHDPDGGLSGPSGQAIDGRASRRAPATRTRVPTCLGRSPGWCSPRSRRVCGPQDRSGVGPDISGDTARHDRWGNQAVATSCADVDRVRGARHLHHRTGGRVGINASPARRAGGNTSGR